MYALEATEISKHFGAVQALRSFTLQVRKGELISLLGPSGCGKTTLLRIIAGFIEPDGGRIAIAGAEVGHVPTHKRNLGMVFQSYSLWPHMNVAENVAFGLASRGVARAARRQQVDHALELGRAHRSVPNACRASFRAASSSASPWPARWSTSPISCCSTSPCRRSTASFANGCSAT